MTVAFRSAELEDARFIVSSWSRAFKGSNSAGMIADEDWATVMHPQIKKVLARPGARTIVAYEKTDPAFIYGFAAGDTDERIPVVFFVYVKEPYRLAGYRNGVRIGDGYGRRLLAALGVDPAGRFRYTCWTPVIRDLQGTMGRPVRHEAERVPSKIPYATFDPHFARYPKPETRTPDVWKR